VKDDMSSRAHRRIFLLFMIALQQLLTQVSIVAAGRI